MRILLDMDGVLTDFHSASVQFHNVGECHFVEGEWDTVNVMCKQIGINESIFWKSFNVEFWERMLWMGDGREILDTIYKLVGTENVCICSSPANEVSAHGKYLWIKKNLPELYSKGNFIFNRNKGFLAHKGVCLVDDGDHNLLSFIKNGGQAIRVPRFWNCESHLKDKTIETIKDRLVSLIKDNT